MAHKHLCINGTMYGLYWFPIPSESTRATYLLDTIQCSNAPFQGLMVQVQKNTLSSRKINDSEAKALNLLPLNRIQESILWDKERCIIYLWCLWYIYLLHIGENSTAGRTVLYFWLYVKENNRNINEKNYDVHNRKVLKANLLTIKTYYTAFRYINVIFTT